MKGAAESSQKQPAAAAALLLLRGCDEHVVVKNLCYFYQTFTSRRHGTGPVLV